MADVIDDANLLQVSYNSIRGEEAGEWTLPRKTSSDYLSADYIVATLLTLVAVLGARKEIGTKLARAPGPRRVLSTAYSAVAWGIGIVVVWAVAAKDQLIGFPLLIGVTFATLRFTVIGSRRNTAKRD